jgi:hypothetical protein
VKTENVEGAPHRPDGVVRQPVGANLGQSLAEQAQIFVELVGAPVLMGSFVNRAQDPRSLEPMEASPAGASHTCRQGSSECCRMIASEFGFSARNLAMPFSRISGAFESCSRAEAFPPVFRDDGG